MILDNGVVRTLDPSLPTCGALAIAGPIVAGGVGTHEWMLPTPERVNLAGRCVLPAFTDSHVHFPTWSLARHDVRLEEADSVAAALALVAGHPRRGTWIRGTGWRDAAWSDEPGPTADGRGARHGHGRHPGCALVEGLPLALAQLRRPRARRRESRRARRGRRALRRREADGDPARGVGLALPRPLRHRHRGRVGRGDARGHSRRQRERRRARSTTRTAGSAPPRSSVGSTSRRACRCGSGSRSRSTGCPRSPRCRCARGSATTSSASAT